MTPPPGRPMATVDPSKLTVLPGRAFPMGPTVHDTGVRFAVFSRHATRVWLALFERIEDTQPVCEFEYHPEKHRIGDVWSLFVEGLGPGALYAFRMAGPFDPARGHRFKPDQFLLDPYARTIVGRLEDNTLKCRAVDEDLDWTGDLSPRVPLNETIIYETHVRGLTIHESAFVDAAGTFRGLIDKIPYLNELGVTAVELLPVQEPGEYRLGRSSIDSAKELLNYWGYNSIGFFAPCARLAQSGPEGGQIDEFRSMVAALHRAGIEVILDVVFNHTAEGDADGPTLSFRGIDNAIYYTLDENGGYRDFAACGNTMNCNHPLVRDFILDCLRYWAAVLHVDGFRFDLASILARDPKGDLLEKAPLIERIAEDPILRNVKLIAEAWDVGGAYQVGSFGMGRWAEWNGRYRDDVRRFWRGEAALKADFAARIAGSADLYLDAGRTPQHTINFITCHDGFTLRDLVSFDQKHNRGNGEGNEDGSDHNFSWNCGVEGDTDDPEILALRLRMQKNLLATLFLSLGVPMLLGGDEFGRSQQGNNNAYCQDNELSWYDWRLTQKNAEILRFCKAMVRFRKGNPVFTRTTFFTGGPVGPGFEADAAWFDASGAPQAWNEDDGTLAWRIHARENGGVPLYLIFNPSPSPVEFHVPGGAWAIAIDTAVNAPSDCPDEEDRQSIDGPAVRRVEARSMVVLTGR